MDCTAAEPHDGWARLESDEIEVCVRDYTYKTVQNREIKASVYRLPGDEIRPAILWIHGGALVYGNRKQLERFARWELVKYLEAGLVVVSIDYRLAPETKQPDIVRDVEDAYVWIRDKGPDEFFIDSNRVAVIGHSAGARLAMLVGFRVEPRPKALVSFYGQSGILTKNQPPVHSQTVTRKDAFAAIGDSVITEAPMPSEREKFVRYCNQNSIYYKEVLGFDPWDQPERYKPFCAIRNVDAEYPPTMLLHGDQDRDTAYENSVRMAEVLNRHGVVHDFKTLRGYGHGFDGIRKDEPDVQAAFRAVLRFLGEHLSGE